MSEYTAGLDLGQVADATALVVVRRADDASSEVAAAAPQLEVVGLWRWHGVSYVETAVRVRELLGCAPYAGRLRLVADGSGVGRAVVDLLRREPIHGVALTPVTITAGEQHSPPVPDAFNYWPVPKIALVRQLYQLIEGRRITVTPPSLPGAEDLRAELANFAATFTTAGHLRFAAATSTSSGELEGGAHDDYVSALLLACWGAIGLPTPRIRRL